MAQVRCSICGKLFESDQSPAMPFCCHRCRLIDLGRWLDERYGLSQGPEEDVQEPRNEATNTRGDAGLHENRGGV